MTNVCLWPLTSLICDLLWRECNPSGTVNSNYASRPTFRLQRKWRMKGKEGKDREIYVWVVCVYMCVHRCVLWPPPCVQIQVSVCTTGSGPAEIWGYTPGRWSCSAPHRGPSPPPVHHQDLKKTRLLLIQESQAGILWWLVKWFIYLMCVYSTEKQTFLQRQIKAELLRRTKCTYCLLCPSTGWLGLHAWCPVFWLAWTTNTQLLSKSQQSSCQVWKKCHQDDLIW